MIHEVVVCERCGSRWDLTEANLDSGNEYIKNIFSRRSYTIKTIESNRAAGTFFEDRRVDLCDGCYNRIERFIMGGKEYDNILEDDKKE